MSRMASNSYEVGRLGTQCATTGELISPGDAFVAALSEAEQGGEGDGTGLLRHDYSVAAWEGGARPERLFAFWRGVAPEPNVSNKLALDTASLTDLFEQLAGATEPRRVAFRYILALILVRKRALQLVGTRDGVTLMRIKGSAPEEAPVEVQDPDMDPQTLADVTEQLRAALGLEE